MLKGIQRIVKGLKNTQLCASFLPRLHRNRLAANPTKGNLGIVFSCDRALQLNALLESYFHYTKNRAPLLVIYRASNSKHARSYQHLIEQLGTRAVTFVQERKRSFKDELCHHLKAMPRDRVFLLSDNLCFTNLVDFQDFEDMDSELFIPCLNLGMQLDRFSQSKASLPKPEFLAHPEVPIYLIGWLFQNGTGPWANPLNLQGCLLNRLELLTMLEMLDFTNPKNMTTALRAFLPLFQERFGLAYETSRLMKLSLGQVELTHKSKVEPLEADLLREKWNQDLRIDWLPLSAYPNRSVEEEMDLSFHSKANSTSTPSN